MNPDMFGKAESITLNNPKGFISIRPYADTFWTLLVHWNDTSLGEELVSCIDECIYSMRHSISESSVIPKIELSQYITSKAKTIPNSLKKYLTIFCEEMKSIPSTLATERLRASTILFSVEMISNVVMLDHNSLLIEK